MSSIPLLITLLLFLILLAGFLSAAEAGITSISRYQLRHLQRKKHKSAGRLIDLLEQPDYLTNGFWVASTVVTILASAVATLLSLKLFNKESVFPVAILLTMICLVFVRILPKTLALLYPVRVAFFVSRPLAFLLKLLYPFLYIVNGIANKLLHMFKINIKKSEPIAIDREKLITVISEADNKIADDYQQLITGIINLNEMNVEDIKVPRNDIVGIDLDNDWEKILEQLTSAQHTRLPIYREDINQVQGMLHLGKALRLLAQGKLSKAYLSAITEEVYFIPEGTPLNIQLLNFKISKSRVGLIVDEYGDVQGLLSLEDILKEAVGELKTDGLQKNKMLKKQIDGSYLADGSITIRELNRLLNLHLPVDGPNTLSGLIVEYLEMIPVIGVAMKVANTVIEILEIEDNTVKRAQIWPKIFNTPQAAKDREQGI